MVEGAGLVDQGYENIACKHCHCCHDSQLRSVLEDIDKDGVEDEQEHVDDNEGPVDEVSEAA